MPQVHPALASRLERWFGRPAHVQSASELGERFRRIRFGGPALCERAWKPGQEVEFLVADGAFRHYSPSSFDADRGSFDVIFYLHDHGPGSRWAAALELGQTITVLGPGGRLGLDPRAEWHLVAGDETALGVAVAFCTALGSGAWIDGVIELDDVDVLKLLRLPLIPLCRTRNRGEALVDWVSTWHPPPGRGAVYLLGHAGTIAEARRKLVAAGVPRRWIHARAYWATGRVGL